MSSNSMTAAIEKTHLAKLTLEACQRLRPDKERETAKVLFLELGLIV